MPAPWLVSYTGSKGGKKRGENKSVITFLFLIFFFFFLVFFRKFLNIIKIVLVTRIKKHSF